MKKIIALLMAGMMTASVFAGCGAAETGSSGSSTDSSGSTDSSSETSDTADWDYIKNKGKMTIGITYFEPMNYKDDNGELTGFETEFATAVCAVHLERYDDHRREKREYGYLGSLHGEQTGHGMQSGGC